jgi:hypothetical protein
LNNSRIYDSSWIYSKNGYGVIIYPDKILYCGYWNDNKRDCVGYIRYPDGRMYDGYWLDEKKNGFGEITNPDSSLYKGN